MLVRTLLTAVLLLLARASLAADYKLAPLAEAAPAQAFSPEIEKLLAPQGVRVSSGATRQLCDIWLAKSWTTLPDFKPSSDVLYPFSVGELIGVVRYNSKGGDFRNQEIPSGLYTLRYGKQPVDGNHVGTSDTRDFLLLIPANLDKDPKPLMESSLFKLSPKAAGGTHPAMLSLLRIDGEPGELPTLRHDEERELWSVRLAGQSAGKGTPLAIEFVVVGHAPE